MKNFLLIIFFSSVIFTAFPQQKDLLTANDLKQFGTGTIYLKDKTIIRKVTIQEIKDFWMVYEKEGSLHDLMMEEIKFIEFKNCAKCPIKIIFEQNKPTAVSLISSSTD